MKLTSENVNAILHDCLYKNGEDTTGHIRANGITVNVGFHPDRIALHKDEIIDMLMQLPEVFRKSSGGGMSFLNACQDINDDQWTGEHCTMEALFLLGIAIDWVEFLLSREMWSAFPGGVPYVMIKDTE
jgi:hypothetical protein